jgi:hypothetical protein
VKRQHQRRLKANSSNANTSTSKGEPSLAISDAKVNYAFCGLFGPILQVRRLSACAKVALLLLMRLKVVPEPVGLPCALVCLVLWLRWQNISGY